jgi:hypothetical protein
MARTGNFVNYNAAERCICNKKQRSYPFCVARIVCYVVSLAEERHLAERCVEVGGEA